MVKANDTTVSGVLGWVGCLCVQNTGVRNLTHELSISIKKNSNCGSRTQICSSALAHGDIKEVMIRSRPNLSRKAERGVFCE
jgi:hypothetical protein